MTLPPNLSDDHYKAATRLLTNYGRGNWNNTGYFDVPGEVMRDMVRLGYAEARKRTPSSPAEYRGVGYVNPLA